MTDELKINKAKEIVCAIGVPSHVKGYLYLVAAIVKCAENPDCLKNFSKQVYPFVAEQYKVTEPIVKREMNHAIQIAWDRGMLAKYYEGMDKKPTTKKVVTLIVDGLRLKDESNHKDASVR